MDHTQHEVRAPDWRRCPGQQGPNDDFTVNKGFLYKQRAPRSPLGTWGDHLQAQWGVARVSR